jgi:hypothetical protein
VPLLAALNPNVCHCWLAQQCSFSRKPCTLPQGFGVYRDSGRKELAINTLLGKPAVAPSAVTQRLWNSLAPAKLALTLYGRSGNFPLLICQELFRR